MSKTFTPLRYPGGKSQFYNQVVNILTANNISNVTYVEPFAGGAGVGIKLLLNNKVDNIIINDNDKAIYSFWHTVVHHNKWLISEIEKIEINIGEWKRQKDIYSRMDFVSKKELGLAVLFLNRCNRSGILHAGPIGGKNQSGKYKIDCRFNKKNLISIIKQIGMFKNKIKVCNYDASKLIKKLRAEKNVFWFIDPPYYVKGGELYKNSFSHRDHKDLCKTITRHLLNQTWILTYDMQKEIFDLYKSFQYRITTLTYSVGEKKQENEYLFYNNLIIDDNTLDVQSCNT